MTNYRLPLFFRQILVPKMPSLTTFLTKTYNLNVGHAGTLHSSPMTASRCVRDKRPLPRSADSEREALVPVQMELKRIVINEVNEQQVIMLREVDGERSFPIVIGIFEATSIDRRVKGVQSPRPLTHDLITNVIDQLGGDLQDIYISDLRDHTYFAKLRIRKDGELIDVDCRPSDAIAIAVTARVPIFVAEDVLNEAMGEM